MNRLVEGWGVLGIAIVLTGCGGRAEGESENLSAPPHSQQQAVLIPEYPVVPPEYSIVAEAITMPLHPAFEMDRELSPVEVQANLRVDILKLEAVDSKDLEISSVAKQGYEVYRDLEVRIERIKSLPQPDGLLRAGFKTV